MNMTHWDNLKSVPREALKTIDFGKLKGKSDINPQWRYEVMTREFGVCGIGWKYQIIKTWTQDLADGQAMLFVEINLYIKDGEQWSEPIPAIGGDFVIEKDKNGIHGNDEAYKMATTDALGVAMKMLGVAADVYRGLANDSKYGREKVESVSTPAPPQKPASAAPTQSDAKPKGDISDKQIGFINKLAVDHGMTQEDLSLLIKFKFNADSITQLSKKQASLIIANILKLWEEYVAFVAGKEQIAATKTEEIA